ncbi:hypothetical protein [Aureispira anguillae]|uniref:ABC transporter permease n=1 Tax=Aureispira anguillae TaxID=2864201 RepID=A0A916DWR5_9BACT|nr:hypothetical protein [Aureispira anguillae]BDS14276.1 hypothetical protein AsAng_0050550 [Aureispira anguillae]
MFRSIRSIWINWQTLLRLVAAFAIPYLLFSSLMTVAAVHINEALEGGNSRPRLGLMGKEHLPLNLLKEFQQKTNIVALGEEGDLLLMLEADSIDLGLVIPSDFYQDSSYNGTINAYYNSMQNRVAVEDALDILESYEKNIVAQTIENMGMDARLVHPIKVKKSNTFNALVMLGKIMEQVKGALSNVLNLLFVLLILWMVRNLVLRASTIAPPKFGLNLILIFIGTLLAMLLVFVGFQLGMNSEQEGMVRGILLSIQQLLVWDKLGSSFLLWCPTWLFIIGLLGWVVSSSKTTVDAYVRTFWVAVLLHIIAFWGQVPIAEMTALTTYIPVFNVFSIGQLAMKGTLDSTTWYLAFGATLVSAILVNGLWFRYYKKNLLAKKNNE